ncbi:hypothetical protein RSPO_m01393 (plasmid) [Ralstonia solanacearum Po82]|uniref:Uncharacterized protein n=1 Tax=Ralstonia solanacearum (strain Po82) TaxID=1031711 RepID=F6GBG2_RALS8|nr:hypothetical protein RSPO_m01393 [Ralstonia solanacearum Po82]
MDRTSQFALQGTTLSLASSNGCSFLVTREDRKVPPPFSRLQPVGHVWI